MSRTVYVNGALPVPEEEAKISVFDSGFFCLRTVFMRSPVCMGGKLLDFDGHADAA